MAILAPLNLNSSTWTNYVVASVCRRITLCEVNQAGTTDYTIADPSDTSKLNTKPAGSKFTYENPNGTFFKPGDIPFQGKTVTGSVNFDRTEE